MFAPANREPVAAEECRRVMQRIPLVVHERLGEWGRQLRPRVIDWPVRLVESRTTDELTAAASGSPTALVLLDLGQRLVRGMEDLGELGALAPQALVLVLAPHPSAELDLIARELGATAVLSGPATPPIVLGLLARWLTLARRRLEAEGWAATLEPEPEPWFELARPIG